MKLLLLLSHTCEMRSQISNSKTPNDFKFEISEFRSLPVKKIDEGRENNAANKRGPARASRVACQNTSRHTSPEDGDLADSRKGPRSHPLKAPCLHLAPHARCPRGDPALSQIGTSIVKKLKERALSLPGKLPAPSILAIFALRFGSGSPLPLN